MSSISSIKVLSVKQITHFGFPLILFFEIRTNLFGNVLLACFFTVFMINLYVFITCKNYFCFLLRLYSFTKTDDLYWRKILLLLLCFCFKNPYLLDRQATQFNFSLSTLFLIFISCGLKLWVQSLHLKQYVVPIFFPVFIIFVFDCVFFISCFVGRIFFDNPF